MKGRCIAPPGPVKRVMKVRIKLNNTLMVHGTSYEILGTLIHEMLHAYLVLARSKSHGEEDVRGLAERVVGLRGWRLGMLSGRGVFEGRSDKRIGRCVAGKGRVCGVLGSQTVLDISSASCSVLSFSPLPLICLDDGKLIIELGKRTFKRRSKARDFAEKAPST